MANTHAIDDQTRKETRCADDVQNDEGISARVEFRMPLSLKREAEEAARLMGMTLTAFATQALVERARKVKIEHSVTKLNDEERDALLSLLANPPKPTEALRKLFKSQ